MDDPRVVEFRAALADLDLGVLGPVGARARYDRAIGPYLECMAQHTPAEPPFVRVEMMAALHRTGLPIASIIAAYDASEDEERHVRSDRAARELA